MDPKTKAQAFLSAYVDAVHTSAMNDYKPNPKIAELASKLTAVIDSADLACDWLCDSYPGSDQRKRGNKLRKALKLLTVQ